MGLILVYFGALNIFLLNYFVCRYNFERLCNKMARVVRFLDWRKPISEGYFPKLDSLVSSRGWPSRVANATLSNLFREVDQVKFDVDDLERWRDRIFAAIHAGSVMSVSNSLAKVFRDLCYCYFSLLEKQYHWMKLLE